MAIVVEALTQQVEPELLRLFNALTNHLTIASVHADLLCTDPSLAAPLVPKVAAISEATDGAADTLTQLWALLAITAEGAITSDGCQTLLTAYLTKDPSLPDA